jgi:hypothetical protein
MPRRNTPTQADMTRALKAALSAGLNVGRVEVDGSKIVIVATSPAPLDHPATELDTWRAKRHARAS